MFELRYDRTNVGRKSLADGINPEVDLTALDQDGTVSRRHAVVVREGEMVVVEDLGSSNGTFVNGTKIQPGLQQTLQSGDEVRFGSLIFKFRRNSQ